MSKLITVFGSSLPKAGEKEYADAYKLGKLLAGCGFNVCTGGYQGVMDAVSKGAKENGAEAIGVTVRNWNSVRSNYLTQEIICNSLFDRISKLVDTADAYVILQGGTGTLLELAVVWEFMNKKIIENMPVACHSSMWKEIVTIMELQIVKEKRTAGLINCFKNVEEIAEFLSMKLLS